MGVLSVVILAEQPTRWSEVCHESLTGFAPELEEVRNMPKHADIGSIVRLVQAPFVAFLDPRTVVSPGWAGRLIRALEGAGAGAVGPLSNGAAGPQRRAADYQDIEGYLAFAEQIAEAYDGRVQAVEALEEFCFLTRRELLMLLDSSTRVGGLTAVIRAAGHQLVVALDTYLHSFGEYYQRARPEIQRLVPSHARVVLDVGCGAGVLGATLKRRGTVEVVGVEVDPDAAAAAERVLDRVHVGDIELLELPYETSTFDCIILADVLEHLRDPWALLRRLTPLLGAHGRVIASLPNIRHWSVLRGLLQGKWTYLPAGILDRGHLRFFTLKSGRALLEAAGLAILEVHPLCSGSVPDLAPLIHAGRSLSLDCSTLADEARATQYLYVAEKRG
jgi:2-polyprenyl-3-methyl-5-hydroxy-6-metoxy-1,4-benzoquinol methylase